METINLGAVLFALLLLVWLLYAVPRIAERRDLMGHARAVDLSRDSRAARDLTDAAHHRRRDPEVHAAMPENRLLTRPVDPTITYPINSMLLLDLRQVAATQSDGLQSGG